MKKIFIISSFIISVSSFSQSISVKESNEKFSSGFQNAVTTTIFENNLNDVLSEWKKVLRDFKNEKVKDDNNEVFGDNIIIKDWGNNPVDIYTKFEENKSAKTVKMMVAVDLGGAYLTSSADKSKYNFIEKLVKDFAVKQTKAPLEEAVKDAEKLLAKKEDQQKDLEKDNKNLNNDIIDYKAKIGRAETDVIAKDGEITKKKSEVAIQKKVVEASSGAVNEQAKSSKKIYDKLADQEKDLERDKKDLKSDIEKYKDKIKDAEKDIKKNEEEQTKKKAEIDAQKKVVETVTGKLKAVN
jgi:chromosome segregation ATPase